MVREWQPDPDIPPPHLFLVSAGVYAQRGGDILILKRAGGEMGGAWDVPGGVVDPGETPLIAAARELEEEAGIRPTGPLQLIGITAMHIYGHEGLRVMYAADCDDGEVRISHEHEAARWIDPADYRARFFSDDVIRSLETSAPRHGDIARAVRDSLDEYLAWRAAR